MDPIAAAPSFVAQVDGTETLDVDSLPPGDNSLDVSDETAAALKPEVPTTLRERIGVAPANVMSMNDIRAKLMEAADLVIAGKLTHEQVADIIEILNRAAAIDPRD